MKNSLRILMTAVLVAALAGPALGEVFTVALSNGASFKTRYQPIQSSVDSEKIQFLSDTGNWITLAKDIVTGITSETESRGFGTIIDTQTIALGWDPTSLAVSEEAENAEDPTMQILNYLMARDRVESAPPAPFSNQQFVEPTEAGGIPVWMSNQVTPPIGGAGGQ